MIGDKDCPACGGDLPKHQIGDELFVAVPVCDACARRYPPSLLKACDDYFDYALKLRTGEIIAFHMAQIHGDYVRLTSGTAEEGFEEKDWRGHERQLPFPCPRGIDVRLEDIVWCVDAPEGS